MARVGLILLLSLVPSWAVAQDSLADAAQKERQRREKAAQAGAHPKVLTEDDLAAAKGQVANAASTTASPAPALVAPAPGSQNRPTPVRPAANAAPDLGKNEAYWRGRHAAAKARLDGAQKRWFAMERVIHGGQPMQYDASGRLVMYANSALKQMADQAEAELNAARKAMDDLEEEARKAGALPGWVRDE
jgi:hypothetical protein